MKEDLPVILFCMDLQQPPTAYEVSSTSPEPDSQIKIRNQSFLKSHLNNEFYISLKDLGAKQRNKMSVSKFPYGYKQKSYEQ